MSEETNTTAAAPEQQSEQREQRREYNNSDRGGDRPYRKPNNRFRRGRKKVCQFCADKNAKIDYKDALKLKKFLTERGKIQPRRMSGTCAKHQRELATAIKRSRTMALIPYVQD